MPPLRPILASVACTHALPISHAVLASDAALEMHAAAQDSKGPGEGFDVQKFGDGRCALIGAPLLPCSK